MYKRQGQWQVDEHGQRLVLLDRRTDLIVSGGENVSPQRVEAVLLSHPDVEQACVVGLPDAQWGARVEAVVCAKTTLNLSDVSSWCATRLAAFEMPKTIHQWPSLPTATLEKISRAAVRARLLVEDQDPRGDASANARA